MPSHTTSWRSILILSFHLRQGLSSDSFPQVFPPEPCIHLSSPPIHATWHAHLILLALIARKIGVRSTDLWASRMEWLTRQKKRQLRNLPVDFEQDVMKMMAIATVALLIPVRAEQPTEAIMCSASLLMVWLHGWLAPASHSDRNVTIDSWFFNVPHSSDKLRTRSCLLLGQ